MSGSCMCGMSNKISKKSKKAAIMMQRRTCFIPLIPRSPRPKHPATLSHIVTYQTLASVSSPLLTAMPSAGGQKQMCRCPLASRLPTPLPLPLLLAVALVLLVLVLPLPTQSHALAPPSITSSSSSSSSTSGSGRPPLPPQRKTQDLGRLLKEQELRALAKLEAAAQALLESETEVDASGVRRPLDRHISFTPSSSSSFSVDRRKARQAAGDEEEEQGGKRTGGGQAKTSTRVAAAAADEHVTPAVDGQLLRQAYQARKARVEELSQFRSRRGKQRSGASRNGGKVGVYPCGKAVRGRREEY